MSQLAGDDFSASLEDWLARREASFDIKSGQASKVVWPSSAGEPLRQVIVYLHGFSASPHDTDPLIRNLAQDKGVPVVYVRFTGHGLVNGELLGQATAQDWINDAIEGLEIGRALADQIVVIGMSTGALPIVQILAEQPEWANYIREVILLSPNFAPKSILTQLVTGPFGPAIARMVRGPRNSFVPYSEGHAERWTTSYPWEAVRSVMDLVNTVSQLDLRVIKERGVRVLCLYVGNDTVVRTDLIPKRCQEMGGETVDLPEAALHELTGEALQLVANEPQIRGRITRFLNRE